MCTTKHKVRGSNTSCKVGIKLVQTRLLTHRNICAGISHLANGSSTEKVTPTKWFSPVPQFVMSEKPRVVGAWNGRTGWLMKCLRCGKRDASCLKIVVGLLFFLAEHLVTLMDISFLTMAYGESKPKNTTSRVRTY